MAEIKSYADHFHYDDDAAAATACREGGDCENCGAGGQQFYCHRGAVGPKKLCERCARSWCGVAQRQPHEPANVGSNSVGG